VDMDLREVGRVAAEALLDAIAGNRDRGVRTNPCRLVIRDSTGPGRKARESGTGAGGARRS
jgi:LacI family transcriptional regulator